ncbi:MAG: radical SAM protein [Spirochaetales bacterium]|nr:radical SAM protein [Spirochaetales bacterium]
MNNPPKTALVTIHVEANSLAFPLAAAQLKAALPKGLSKNTDIKDFYLAQKPSVIAEELAKTEYDAIGFSSYIWNARQVRETAELLKKANPKLIIIAGGPHVSAMPDFFLKDDLFDFLIKNEGEYALEKAIGSEPQEKTVVLDGPRVNMETLASPFLSGAINTDNYDGVLWELSRGCPYNCAFCYEARNHGFVRRFPMSRLAEELKLFIKKGVREVWILDSTFNHDEKWCTAFLEMLAEEAPHIHFTFEIRAERVTEQQARLFGKLVASLQIGLQSSNPEVMARLNRPFKPQNYKKKIRLLEQNYLVYGFDLIYGLPGDTLESFKESLDYTLTLSPSNIDIFRLSLLPGTELDDRAEEFGIVHDGSYERLVVGRPGFTDEDLEEAEDLTELCDFFYTKGLASIWFKTACDALELTPSFFLERFGIWLEQNDFDREDLADLDPAPLQKEFLEFCFSWRNKKELYLPLESYILWHEGLNMIMEGEEERIVELNYDPDSLTQLDVIGLANFATYFPPTPQNWRIFTEENNVYWEPIV